MTKPRRQPVSPEEAALFVVRALREAGHEGLYAGGCVRDRLLGRTPNDYDVATDAEPSAVQALFKRTLAVGEQFGIVIVRYRGQQIEVATFRTDGDYSDGRRPDSVAYTRSPADDAQRRDFTVNGLFFDPIAGEVRDYVEGVADVVAGRIRAIGDARERFREDRLRILRAPRFAAVLGFRLAEETAAAGKAMASEIATSGVSPERIRVELLKLLKCPGRARGWRWCRELDLLPVVFASAPGAVAGAERAERALAELPAQLDPERALGLPWAAALHPGTLAEAEATLRALRCSNKEREATLRLLAGLEQARAFPQLALSAQKRLLRKVDPAELALLLRATALAGEGDLRAFRQLQARRAAFAAELGPARVDAKPLIMGKDLGKAGIKPGPVFGRVLPQVEDAQLEGRVRTKQEALALALELAQES